MMKFAFYTCKVSPHQMPLARELVKTFGVDSYRYVYTMPIKGERAKLGWKEEKEKWILYETNNEVQAREILRNAEILLCGERDIGLIEYRSRQGLRTIYSSERWFKPRIGIFRLLWLPFFVMAKKFVRLLEKGNEVYYYPMGVHAARDMARLCGLLNGDITCLFNSPEIEFENKPGGRIWLKNGGDEDKYCLVKMRMWGYFVKPSHKVTLSVQKVTKAESQEVKVLWVGRLLKWKRVDTIVRAVVEHANLKRIDASLQKITLDIYGTGPEEKRLKKMACGHEGFIRFHPPVPIAEVRHVMREHDVYVLSSNAHEGWGAVVNEALEEGMTVIGTYEAGSSATILPKANLFHEGDWRTLLRLLASPYIGVGIGDWSVEIASKVLCHE